MSKEYLKTMDEIKNLISIDFTNEQWDWFLKEAVEKRLDILDKKEAFFLRSRIYMVHAKNLINQMNNQLEIALAK